MRGRVLPLVTSDAVALPTAVRLAVASGSVPWGVGPGDQVRVGAGRVVLPAIDLVAARTWRPARVRRALPLLLPLPLPSGGECGSGGPGDHLRTHGEVDGLLRPTPSVSGPDRGWLADGIRSVVSCGECASGCRDDHLRTHGEVGVAVRALVGRGEGLTPSGDDALAGALLVAHALGTGTALADAVRARLGATTAVSAALLDAAADGYAARPVVTLVDAAVAGDAEALRGALPAVLAIGHTSGADILTGIRVALDSLGSGVGCSDGAQGSHLSTQLEHATGGRAA